MSPQLLRLLLPKRAPRTAGLLAAQAVAVATLPIAVFAAAVDGYREAQAAVLAPAPYRRPRYGHLGPCRREGCGLQAPCPDCGPCLVDFSGD